MEKKDALPPSLQAGDIVGGWKCMHKLGEGTFSEIYQASRAAVAGGRPAGGAAGAPLLCALKYDKGPQGPITLQWEHDVLQKLQKFPFVPRNLGLHTVGGQGKPRVLAMQLLGHNLSVLR